MKHLISRGTPKHWRLRRLLSGKAALSELKVRYMPVSKGRPEVSDCPDCSSLLVSKRLTEDGLQVVVYGRFEEGQRPNREEILAILQAGRAEVLTMKQALASGAHLVVTKASRPAIDQQLKLANEAGLCIVSPQYIVDWVAHPWKPLTKASLFGQRKGARKLLWFGH